MCCQFKYQNEDYLINLDKIEYMIKSNDEKRVYVFLSNKKLQFDFNSEDAVENFYEQLQNAIIESFKLRGYKND